MQPNDIESIINGVSGGDFDVFAGVAPEMARKLQLQQARDEEERQTVAAAWARFYEDPAGRKALEALFDTTLRRATYFAALGTDALQIAVYGSFREGQNSVAHEIARQISRGLADDKGPTPRET